MGLDPGPLMAHKLILHTNFHSGSPIQEVAFFVRHLGLEAVALKIVNRSSLEMGCTAER